MNETTLRRIAREEINAAIGNMTPTLEVLPNILSPSTIQWNSIFREEVDSRVYISDLISLATSEMSFPSISILWEAVFLYKGSRVS